MSKRKYSILNYTESEEISYNKGLNDGEIIATNFKKEPSFNFKSYLDGLCNGYTLEFKSLKCDDSFETISFDTDQLINNITLQTYLNHEKASYYEGIKFGKIIAKNNKVQFINFKSYLDGVCNAYANYENILVPKNLNHLDSTLQSTQLIT